MAALSGLLAAVCIAAGIGVGSRRVHDRFLFHGHTHRKPSAFRPETDQWVKSAGGERLHVRTLVATDPTKKHHIILYCHGNGGNVDDWTETAQGMRAFGDVCIFDYQGYGSSTGTPSAHGILEDGEAVLQAAVFGSPRKYREISVYGQSLGTVVGAHIVASHQNKNKRRRWRRIITRLVLETPLVDIKDVAPSVCSASYYVGVLPNIEILSKLQRINSDETKTSVVVATQDEVIPYHSSRTLLRNYDFDSVLRVDTGHNNAKQNLAYQIWIRRVFSSS